MAAVVAMVLTKGSCETRQPDKPTIAIKLAALKPIKDGLGKENVIFITFESWFLFF